MRKLQKYILMISVKNETLFYLPYRGLDTHRMDRYWILKGWMCLGGLLSKILRSLSQFNEIEARGWPSKDLYVANTSNIRKWAKILVITF